MSLKDLLAGRNIECAHIIDDAFDPEPGIGLRDDAVGLVLANIRHDDFVALCKMLEVMSEDEAEVRSKLGDRDAVVALYRRREELSEQLRHELFDEFEVDRKGKLDQLKPLIDLLTSAGIKCLTFGANYDPKGTAIPQLFFVDLKLRELTLRPAHEDAKEALDRLKSEHHGAKPFVFLMSSQTIALGNSREDFRKAASLFQSEFEAIEKGCFEDGGELERMIIRYTAAIDVHAALHRSMEHVKAAVDQAAGNVLDELRALDFADYFVLYKNTVSVEKIDIGSYVVELLLEYLANEVEGKEKVWELAGELNKLEMGNLRRVRFGWSPAAMRLYSANMLHNSEMLRAEEKMGTGPAAGYFFTGDIFFDAKSYNEGAPNKALSVITPACDLVRPHEMKGKSIVLCEGAVKPVKEANPQLVADDGLPVTLMRHPKDPTQFLTIHWHKKKIHVWDDEARAAFQDANKCLFVRAGRLRPLFALQLQQKVTADLSRVGTQKPPSALNLRGVRCFVCNGESWSAVYEDMSSDAAAWLISEEGAGKKKTRMATILLSDHTVQRAFEKVKEWQENHPTAATKDAVARVLKDDVRDMLKHATAPLPAGDEDPTIYPSLEAENAKSADGPKHLALVREARSSSPYAAIKQGTSKSEKHVACVVFRLEDVQVDSA